VALVQSGKRLITPGSVLKFSVLRYYCILCRCRHVPKIICQRRLPDSLTKTHKRTHVQGWHIGCIQTTFAFYAIPPYITKRIKLTKLKVIFCFCSHGTPDSTRSYQAHVQTSHQLNGRWRRLCQLVRARVQGRLFLPRPLIPSANVTPTLFYNIYLYSIIRVMARDTICDWRWMTGWRGKNDARFSFHDRPTPVLSSFFLSFHLFLSHPFPIHHRDWPY
jgi:hypothetical protein